MRSYADSACRYAAFEEIKEAIQCAIIHELEYWNQKILPQELECVSNGINDFCSRVHMPEGLPIRNPFALYSQITYMWKNRSITIRIDGKNYPYLTSFEPVFRRLKSVKKMIARYGDNRVDVFLDILSENYLKFVESGEGSEFLQNACNFLYSGIRDKRFKQVDYFFYNTILSEHSELSNTVETILHFLPSLKTLLCMFGDIRVSKFRSILFKLSTKNRNFVDKCLEALKFALESNYVGEVLNIFHFVLAKESDLYSNLIAIYGPRYAVSFLSHIYQGNWEIARNEYDNVYRWYLKKDYASITTYYSLSVRLIPDDLWSALIRSLGEYSVREIFTFINYEEYSELYEYLGPDKPNELYNFAKNFFEEI